MADQGSAFTEKNPSGRPESQWQIPFHAGESDSWAESATEKESGTSKVNPQQTWGGLVSPGRAPTVQFEGVLSSDGPSATYNMGDKSRNASQGSSRLSFRL